MPLRLPGAEGLGHEPILLRRSTAVTGIWADSQGRLWRGGYGSIRNRLLGAPGGATVNF